MKAIMQYRDSDLSLGEIAERLRVRMILEGSIQRERDGFHVAAMLLDTRTGHKVWEDRRDVQNHDSSIIYKSLARNVLKYMKVITTRTDEENIIQGAIPSAKAYEFYLRGKFLFDQKEDQEDVMVARGLFQKTIELEPEFLQARIWLGKTFMMEGKYQEAMDAFQVGLLRARKTPDLFAVAKFLYHLGRAQRFMGNISESLQYLSQASNFQKEIEDRHGESITLRELGVIHYSHGDYESALDSFMRALEVNQDLEDQSAEAYCLNNIASTYVARGNYELALFSQNRSLKIKQELGDRWGEANSLDNIGNLYRAMGDSEQALQYHRDALEIRQALGDKKGMGYSFNNLGRTWHQLGNYTKAREDLEKSISIKTDIGTRLGIAFTHVSLGAVLCFLEEYATALEHLEKASVIYEEENVRGELMWALSWKALTEMELLGMSTAMNTAKRVVALLESSQISGEIVAVLWNLSQTYERVGDTYNAGKYLDWAHHEIMKRAEGFEDECAREKYLKNVKENREVIEAWKERKHTRENLGNS